MKACFSSVVRRRKQLRNGERNVFFSEFSLQSEAQPLRPDLSEDVGGLNPLITASLKTGVFREYSRRSRG